MKKSIFLSLTLVFMAFSLISCENFLRGGDFLEQLNKDIAYAKATPVQIRLECDEGMGSISSESHLTKKPTDIFTVEARISPEAAFIAWKAYSEDLKELSAETISFSEETITPDGNCKARVHFKSGSQNILIKPYCILSPAVASYSPKDSAEGFYANTPIVITFNQSMKEEAVLKNIELSWKGQDISSMFEKPSFDSEKKSLTIKPKSEALLESIKGEPYADVDVSVSKEISVTVEGKEIFLYQNGNSAFTVRYKSQVETLPPQKFIFGACRNEVQTDSFDEVTETFCTGKTLESITEEEILQNRTNGTFYIYGRYFDADSGVKSVTVTEKRLKTYRNTDVEENPLTSTFTEEDDKVSFYHDGKGDTYFVINYECFSGEGAISFSVYVSDGSGNVSEKEDFILFKKTFSINSLILCNIPRNFTGQGESTDENFTLDLYNAHARNIKVYEGKNADSLSIDVFGDITLSGKNCSLFCDYTDKNGKFRHESFSEFDEENGYWNLDLDLDSLEGKTVKVIARDDIGNMAEKEFAFPSKLKAFLLDKNYTWSYFNFLTTGSEDLSRLFAYTYSDNENPEETFKMRFVLSPLNAQISSRWESFYVIPICNFLWGDVSEEFVFENQEEIDPVSVKNISLSPSESSGYVDIIITLEDDQWKKYDAITFDYYLEKESAAGTTSIGSSNNFMKAGENTFVFKIKFNNLYGAEGNITIYGIKGLSRSSGITAAIPNISPESVNAFDNSAPKVESSKRYGFDKFRLLFSDAGTGVAWCRVSCADGSVYYSEDDGSEGYVPELLIPFYSLEKSYTVALAAEDKSGNLYEKDSWKFSMETSSCYTHLEKNDSEKWNLVSDPVTDSSISNFGSYVYVSQLNSLGEWEVLLENYKKSSSKYNTENGLVYKITNLDLNNYGLNEGSFVKVYTVYSNVPSKTMYYYTGSKGSGEYDLLLANGNSKSSVAVSSDAPVLLRTLVTSFSYSECCDWTAEEWEQDVRKCVDEKCMTFTESMTGPKKYTIPVEKIEDGKCYCVAAHFSDGTVLLSEVFAK